MAALLSLSLFVALSLLITFSGLTDARITDVYTSGTMQFAHATFYGGSNSETFGSTMATKLDVTIPRNCNLECVDANKCNKNCRTSGFSYGKCWGAFRDPPRDLFCCCHLHE